MADKVSKIVANIELLEDPQQKVADLIDVAIRLAHYVD